MANWNPKIPLNFRTIVFCLLMGTVLSMPAGNLFDSPLQLLTPSQKAIDDYEAFCGFCLLLLPGWICIMMHCRWFTVVFVIFLTFFVSGLMMPVMLSSKVF